MLWSDARARLELIEYSIATGACDFRPAREICGYPTALAEPSAARPSAVSSICSQIINVGWLKLYDCDTPLLANVTALEMMPYFVAAHSPRDALSDNPRHAAGSFMPRVGGAALKSKCREGGVD